MMMKFRFLSTFLIAMSSSLFAVSQWTVVDSCYLKIEYTYQYQPYINDTLIIEEPVVLLVGDEWTEYANARNHQLGLILHAPKQQKTNVSNMIGNTRDLPKAKTHSFSVYRKRSSDSFFVRHAAFPYYQYKESSIDFGWEISGENKEISGYQCAQATGSYKGRNYVAWFAPEIPVLAGPYKFRGLPGLIVSVADSENHHVFVLKGLSDYDAPITKSYTHEYKPYGKWVSRDLQRYQVGVGNGVAYATKTLKTKIVPDTPENRKIWLIASSVLNPIEIESKHN